MSPTYFPSTGLVSFGEGQGLNAVPRPISPLVERIQCIKRILQDLIQRSAYNLSHANADLFMYYDATQMVYANPRPSHANSLQEKIRLQQEFMQQRAQFIIQFDEIYQITHNEKLMNKLNTSFPSFINDFQKRFTRAIGQLKKENSGELEISTIIVLMLHLAEYHLWKVPSPNPLSFDQDNFLIYHEFGMKVFRAISSNHVQDKGIRQEAQRFLDTYRQIGMFLINLPDHPSELNCLNQMCDDFFLAMVIFANQVFHIPLNVNIHKVSRDSLYRQTPQITTASPGPSSESDHSLNTR